MEEKGFKKSLHVLTSALIDEFRGWIVDGERIEVPADLYHIEIAKKELEKIPGWKYVSGTGQNPILEYMELKLAIYITKIEEYGKAGDYQRSVGYLKDVYDFEIEYMGKKQPAYEAIKQIALGMGYDVDEYKYKPERKGVTFENYKGKLEVTKSRKNNFGRNNMSVSENDVPVINGKEHYGFIRNGKFYRSDRFLGYGNNKNKSEGEEK